MACKDNSITGLYRASGVSHMHGDFTSGRVYSASDRYYALIELDSVGAQSSLDLLNVLLATVDWSFPCYVARHLKQ
jgi:hypothetical protein